MGIKKRAPIIAAFLSIITPGLGQFYNGQVKRGVIFFVLISLGLPFLIYKSGLLHHFYGLIISLMLMISFYIFIIGDAFTGSVKAKEIALKSYNKWYIYLLIAIMLAIFTEIAGDTINTEVIGIKAYKIPVASMEPSLIIGDHIIVDIRYYKTNKIQHGDVIVFLFPGDRSKDYIKRVMGLPGDTVELKDKVIYVNGSKMDDPWGINKGSLYGEYSERNVNFGPFMVPEGQVFVMGDNRDRSYDSRYWGPLNTNDIKGKAIYIYWSKERDRIGTSVK